VYRAFLLVLRHRNSQSTDLLTYYTVIKKAQQGCAVGRAPGQPGYSIEGERGADVGATGAVLDEDVARCILVSAPGLLGKP
jgi:hypothetical protein